MYYTSLQTDLEWFEEVVEQDINDDNWFCHMTYIWIMVNRNEARKPSVKQQEIVKMVCEMV